MLEFIGVIITGIGAIIDLFDKANNKPIIKKKNNSNFTWGMTAKIFIIFGIINSTVTTFSNTKSEETHKNDTKIIVSTTQGIDNRIEIIDSTTQSIYELTNNSIEKLYDASEDIKNLIVEQGDSSLKSKLHLINQKLLDVKDTLRTEKEFIYRCYFVNNWPASDKSFNDFFKLTTVIPSSLWGSLDGMDNYIIWKLMENNGVILDTQIRGLEDEILSYLNPLSGPGNVTYSKLYFLGIINSRFWEDNLEFTDYLKKRLKIYNENINIGIEKVWEKLRYLEEPTRYKYF